MKVSEKVFVVTGAGNGIGREVALHLISKGAKVAGIDISSEKLAETATLAASSAFSAHVVNIANLEEVTASKNALNAVHGPVDGVINVAGIIQPFVRVNDLNFDQIKKSHGC
jgi:NADP-dependent 3-hydroxy acid dehydrogenase YdfG